MDYNERVYEQSGEVKKRETATLESKINYWQHTRYNPQEAPRYFSSWLVTGRHIYLVKGDRHRKNNPPSSSLAPGTRTKTGSEG